MIPTIFKALIVEENSEKGFSRNIKDKSTDELPAGDVLIKVQYSTLNYKDGLSASGHKGITRKYPHTPGVDASGIVEESSSELWKTGDEVIVTGYDLGMNTSGGFGQYIRVPAEWVVGKPENMTLRNSMIYGTAGFTAGIAINELQRFEIFPETGKILVTGATGGVGSLAVAMLSKAGYHVIASTGKKDKYEYLHKLGAKEVIDRSEVFDTSNKPLLPKRWIGAIDNVGGVTLSTVLRSTDNRGAVASIGLVESEKLDITVYPFILRGVALIGVDSAERTMEYRLKIWERISKEWLIENIDFIVKEVGLNNLNKEIDLILKGGQCGKVLVNLWDNI